MFCPKCAARNIEDAKYCRACGADISLVPQALTHGLIESAALMKEDAGDVRKRRKKKQKEPPTLDKGLSKIFTGLGLLLIVLLGFFYFFGGVFFWIWFLIPALANFGEGIGLIIRSRVERDRLPPRAPFGVEEARLPSISSAGELTQRETSEIAPTPLSVTEGTTRHLDTASRSSS